MALVGEEFRRLGRTAIGEERLGYERRNCALHPGCVNGIAAGAARERAPRELGRARADCPQNVPSNRAPQFGQRLRPVGGGGGIRGCAVTSPAFCPAKAIFISTSEAISSTT